VHICLCYRHGSFDTYMSDKFDTYMSEKIENMSTLWEPMPVGECSQDLNMGGE
jgi:hypothetical protein